MLGDTELRTKGKTDQAEDLIQNTVGGLKDSQREDGRRNPINGFSGGATLLATMRGRSASVARQCQTVIPPPGALVGDQRLGPK
jgi:hypothetical protein